MKKQYNHPAVEQIHISPLTYICYPPSANTDVIQGDPQQATSETPAY